jgi:hypothetical protein
MKRFHNPRLIWACRVVDRGRFNRNLARLRRAVGPLNQFARETLAQAQLFPLLAVLDGLKERGAFEPEAFRSYRERRWWAWMRSAFGLMLMRAWHTWLGEHLRREYPDRPGWNDYYMMLWCMTGTREYALALYRRAVELPGPGGTELDYYRASSCRWMVASMRSQHPDFDRVMSELEEASGVPLLSLVPTPFPEPVV